GGEDPCDRGLDVDSPQTQRRAWHAGQGTSGASPCATPPQGDLEGPSPRGMAAVRAAADHGALEPLSHETRSYLMKTDPTFLLVHGSWHDGASPASVARHLRDAGYRVEAPTLAGHGVDCERGSGSHHAYVRSVVDELDRLNDPAVLVGHSFGGSVISRVAHVRPDLCALLVYYSAFVPRDGESVADSLPDPFIAFLDEAAAASPDRSVTLPRELFLDAFANTADEATAAAFYEQLVPEPVAPIFEPLPLAGLA